MVLASFAARISNLGCIENEQMDIWRCFIFPRDPDEFNAEDVVHNSYDARVHVPVAHTAFSLCNISCLEISAGSVVGVG